tara:strand:- start:32499 stop:33803 length:1305 start_codon:yes stop_codon:yes gene_type:complete
MNIIPGSYKIIAIELFSDFSDDLVFEMGSIAVEVNLYENMFENCITGNMIFNDSRNVYGNLPILGYETVNINYSVSVLDPNNNSVTTEEFEQSYKIYSISDYQKENPTVSAYAVNFISEKYFTDITTTISKSYVGQPISGIVNSILVNDLKLDADEINIEDTLPQQNLIIPNWTPFEALNWLANRAISETYKGASYVFFQDKDKYNFVSLESLFNDIEDSNITTYSQLVRSMVTPNPYIIKSIDFDQSIDISENITSGMYANKIIEHDIVKRSFIINEFNYADSYDAYKHMNNGKLDLTGDKSYSKKYDSKIMYVPKHMKKYNNLNYSDSVQTSLPVRISQLQQLNNFAVTIIVAGDTTKTIGDVVDLRVVSPEPSGVRDVWDPVYSGRYLIVSLRHTIDADKYNTTITAVKDSYQDNLEDTIPGIASDTIAFA